MPRSAAQPYAIQAVEEALRLLEAMVTDEEGGISALSQRLGLSKTKVFRLLATLQQRGYVAREEDGRYALGSGAFEIGQKFLARMAVLRQAKPVMEQLCRSCDEDVYLAIPRGNDLLLLDMVHSGQRIVIMPLVGRRFPLKGSAMGQLLLGEGGRGRGRVRELPAGDFTATAGCLGAVGTLGPGIAEWAVPLRDNGGLAVAALALLGPDFRLGAAADNERLLLALREAGEVISSRLGFLPPATPARLPLGSGG